MEKIMQDWDWIKIIDKKSELVWQWWKVESFNESLVRVRLLYDYTEKFNIEQVEVCKWIEAKLENMKVWDTIQTKDWLITAKITNLLDNEIITTKWGSWVQDPERIVWTKSFFFDRFISNERTLNNESLLITRDKAMEMFWNPVIFWVNDKWYKLDDLKIGTQLFEKSSGSLRTIIFTHRNIVWYSSEDNKAIKEYLNRYWKAEVNITTKKQMKENFLFYDRTKKYITSNKFNELLLTNKIVLSS